MPCCSYATCFFDLGFLIPKRSYIDVDTFLSERSLFGRILVFLLKKTTICDPVTIYKSDILVCIAAFACA